MTTTTNNPAGHYAAVNGINIYYEIHGEGTPLIMLHGGFGTFEMLSAIAPTLAKSHQVIGVDLYGHGRTALIDRPIDPEQMADDIAGLIQHLGFVKADVLGYSLGGLTALQTAIRHPALVNKLVVISIPYKRSGWYPEVRAGMEAISGEFMVGTPLYEEYVRVAPRPDDFMTFATRMREAMSRDYDWSEQVATLKTPTLLIAGDADSFSPIFAAEFYALLGGGQKDAGWDGANRIPSQLAILPGATHYNIIFRTDLLLPIIVPFLK